LIFLIGLGGTDEQLDFPVIYASAIEGYLWLGTRKHDIKYGAIDANDSR
jgi:predicted membrane GTPase involved in stress response